MSAPWTLWRQIIEEAGVHTLLGLLLFGLVILAGGVLQRLDELISAGASPWVVAQLCGLILPTYLVYAVPAALLFGVLIALGRMSADGEIVALSSSGVSLYRLIPPIFILGALMCGLGAYVTCEVKPRSQLELRSMMRAVGSVSALVEPGRVRPFGPGKTIYVDALGAEDCPLRGLVISDHTDRARPYYVASRCGSVRRDEASQSRIELDLTDGSIHLERHQSEAYRVLHFSRGSIALDLQRASKGRRVQHYSMRDLLGPEVRGRFPRIDIDTELHRRLALPVGALVLGLLGLPLGVRPVRSVRSSGSLAALGVMALYWCLLTTGETVSESGWAPAWLALWLPNLMALALALLLTRRRTRGER